MSFKLGSFNSDSVTGFKAILKAMPVLPVELQLDSLPAGDGAVFYRTRMTATEWEFNLELTGDDLDDVLSKADQISAALNPSLTGPQPFSPNPLLDWEWQGVLAQPIEWERDSVLWFSDRGISRMSGTAVIATPDPYGRQAITPVSRTTAGSLSLPGGGTTSYYPVIEFRGVLNSAQRFQADGFSVAGPLTAGQTLVLDFEALDFYIKTTASGAKVRNVADRIQAFNRLESTGARSIAFSVSAGTFTSVTLGTSIRRI